MLKALAFASLCGVAFAASAQSTEPAPSLPAVPEVFAGVVQEDDVSVLFAYLREALNAAMAGREPPSPQPLLDRSGAIGEEFARRGAIAGRAVLDAIEKALRENLRDTPRRSSAF